MWMLCSIENEGSNTSQYELVSLLSPANHEAKSLFSEIWKKIMGFMAFRNFGLFWPAAILINISLLKLAER